MVARVASLTPNVWVSQVTVRNLQTTHTNEKMQVAGVNCLRDSFGELWL